MIYRALTDMTPFRPEFVSLFPPETWANFEITFSMFVIVMAFAQSKYDYSLVNDGIIGMIGYASLVLKATFGLAVLWDGVYVHAHAMVEHPRPIVAGATLLIGIQQTVHLLTRVTTRIIVRSATVAPLLNEIPTGKIYHGPPQWVMFLVDTPSWVRGHTPSFLRRH